MSVARIATVANTRRHRVVWDRVPELPTVQAAWWGSREQALFVSFFRDPLEYMDNELFANPSAEETIFGRPVQLIPDAARFVDIGGDFTCGRDPAEPDEESNILTTSQEIALFQRFNYARKRLAQQCCEYVNGQLNEEGLRELLAWGDCVNATCNFLAASTMPIARVMARQP
ncbi:MAG: hypothetical protein FWC56_00490, partial [Phycisphaerae bacterium]|nr:hypothetical protein [Phycisphaerae bacterium]